ncbi:hypothetical protein IMG5_202350 [Ichthyophthirius multifiliis]|uniref:Alpha/beta hydrolase fold-3 domain-containing protein n=1 Tax=Ichthyophthirius multifiliis TaxID=5932 RepID=G0R655_ICHMU|nr:hypothetical protein IMG5_202350 [Ichthyophthirius multifiliis]EGR27054.1 hypothetical protein IMG5_202350 [Ichthyophthirius multifiliis]|eukprot:XP_004023938.1 hypothetical protein IMG5_202350 [Ichthyophthirius multifiliis]
MDYGLIKHGMFFAFPFITYNKEIYIDSVINKISLETIKKECKEGTLNQINPQKASLPSLEFNNEDEYYNNLFKQNPNKIKIRILSSKNLQRPTIDNRENEQLENYINQYQHAQKAPKILNNLFENKNHVFTSLIIHIHGGGFVAMSSRSHQTYTRQWAYQLNIPLFCIDYKKAPQYPFPEALNDCWQAYNWIINFVHRFFNVKPQKIILVGDSAGANLAAALTLKCIQNKIQIPTGILLAYPALNLNKNSFTPSFLYSLNDQVLPHTFLKMCLDSYIPDSLELHTQDNPFVSPSCASDEFLKHFPPTRILVGSKDPLHDECWRFLKKLDDLGRSAEIIVYENMPHGFLNYDFPNIMREAKVCIQDAGKLIQKLLDL